MTSRTPDDAPLRAKRSHLGSTRECALDARQVHAAWQALRYPYVKMCVGRIERRLFRANSIVARRGTERLAMTDAFANYARRWLSPFARDVLDALLVLGVVPVAFKRLETGDYAPYVPTYPGYTITTSLENGLQHYRFYWRSSMATSSGFFGLDECDDDDELASTCGHYDPNVYVLSDFGANPQPDGTLRSPLASVAHEILFINEMLDAAVTAERVRAAPPLLFQEAPSSSSSSSAAKALEEGVFGGDVDDVERRELRYTRTREQQREFETQLRAYTAITGRSGFAMVGARERSTAVRARYRDDAYDARGHTMPWARAAFVPDGYTLASLQLPTPPANLVEMIERVQRTICGVLAVPAAHTSSVASDRLRASAEASDTAMDDTAHSYAAMLSRALNIAYEHAFGRNDFRREMRTRVVARRRLALSGRPFTGAAAADTPLVNDDDFFAAVASTSVELGFDLTPATTSETLDELNARGILDWRNYASARLQLANLPSDLAPASDPFTADERKHLLPTFKDSPAAATGTPAKKAKKSASSEKKRKT